MGKWREFKLKTRALYKKVMLPVGSFIGKLGLTPNVITMISGLFAVATAVMYALQGQVTSFNYWWVIGFALMVLTGFIDVIDGSVARATNTTTKFGTVLDPVMDRFAELCFLLGIAIGKYTYEPLSTTFTEILPVGAVCMFSFAGIVFASYARARGESVAPISVESVGIMERREKLMILYIGNILYIWWDVALVFAIALIGLLSYITTIQRMIFIRKKLKELEVEQEPIELESEPKIVEHKETIKK